MCRPPKLTSGVQRDNAKKLFSVCWSFLKTCSCLYEAFGVHFCVGICVAVPGPKPSLEVLQHRCEGATSGRWHSWTSDSWLFGQFDVLCGPASA